ncbi:hypothetical protein [Verrucomicrobium sp. BvORR034]|uniref:hypothetical protein n=1 Tax=Verrucomicrobium sp. BvORR034 TaxID=1396418 RepID=UPI000679E201|nr:hypothetical protein [Verrucomicrobium sp. BvORR034]
MTFEEKLFGKPEEARRFREAARAVFGSAEGRLVLAMLCRAAHPLQHTQGMTEHEHGQCEVVATLWRFGSAEAGIAGGEGIRN